MAHYRSFWLILANKDFIFKKLLTLKNESKEIEKEQKEEKIEQKKL